MKSHPWAIAAVFLLFLLPVLAQGQTMYQKDLAPMFQQYCGQCHGSARGGRGGVNFLSHEPDGKFVTDFPFWNRVLIVLEDRSMPENPERMNFTEVERQKM